jgi:hypothetical protein
MTFYELGDHSVIADMPLRSGASCRWHSTDHGNLDTHRMATHSGHGRAKSLVPILELQLADTAHAGGREINACAGLVRARSIEYQYGHHWQLERGWFNNYTALLITFRADRRNFTAYFIIGDQLSNLPTTE